MNPNRLSSSPRNRDRLDIISDMLNAASTKTKKTRIMYQANLSYVQVEKYLKMLLEEGLLDHDGGSFFCITTKGKEFLEKYAQYLDRFKRLVEEADGTSKNKRMLEDTFFNGKTEKSSA